MAFHRRTGTLISLSNNNTTAQRRYASTEFNNGIVMSSKPLKDNEIFEVKIDKRMNSWSGSVEVGVSACNPETVSLPTSATGLREGTWILSGCNVLKDGHAIKENYGQDLDKLTEGDTLGVMRTGAGILHFFINGQDQGVAAHSMSAKVHAVVDIYGKCMQVTINSLHQLDTNRGTFLANQLANEAIAEATALCSNERLAFHEKCGSLVRLSNNNQTAERQRPNGEFNNGVVMTNRPLKPDELFEIRLDTMIDKWSGSIEVGITTHNPSLLEFPATMTNMRSGTIMMSGCGILTNGKGTQREYGQFNLDELSEADRIGLIRKANGNLHFYINSIDQGVAAENAPDIVWGVVDLYGMAVKVTILDEQSREEEELESGGLLTAASHSPRGATAAVSTPRASCNQRNAAMAIRSSIPSTLQTLSARYDAHVERTRADPRRRQTEYDSDSDNSEHSLQAASESSSANERLTFHPVCGRHVNVINRNRTARRPNAMDEFNHAVVLTHRTLTPGEHFEIQIDKVIEKWAGSVEIGVTTHDPLTLDFPSVMTNIPAGTWMLTGNGVMHDGEAILEDYGYRPDRVKPGDRVGVIRKADGHLYFTVNGVNLGLAASNVPDNIYGVLDLYGQAAEASIVQSSSEESSTPAACSDLRFHTRHGANCVVVNESRSAARPNPREEFNDSVVMSNRVLRPNELFEVTIDKMVDRWSGSLDCGVSTHNPDTLDFPCTMSDMSSSGTWILSGSTIIQEGVMTRTRYNCDLETLGTGSKIGILVTPDRSLHFFLNGVDQGAACTGLPTNVYAVIDLYGTCAGITMTSNTGIYDSQRLSVRQKYTTNTHLHATAGSAGGAGATSASSFSKHQHNSQQKLLSAHNHRFSQCCGKNISLRNEQTTAARVKNFNNAIVFSADPLKTDEIFEIRIDEVVRQWSGSLMIGLTTQTISESHPIIVTQQTALELNPNSKQTWIVNGPKVLHNGCVIKENYPPLLDRLEVGSRVGIRRCHNGTMHVYVNGEDLGVAAHNIPRNVFLVLDVYGMIESVSIISQTKNSRLHTEPSIEHLSNEPVTDAVCDMSPVDREEPYDIDTLDNEYTFHHQRFGRNIQLSHKDTIACRTTGFNQAVVVSSKPLQINNPIELKIDRLHSKWSSSLMIGVTSLPLSKLTELPKSALNMTRSTWIIKSTCVFHNSRKMKTGYCKDLDSLPVGTTLGLSLDESRNLHLHINSVDQGVAVSNVPEPCYVILDLYGQCYQVSIVRDEDERRQSTTTSKEDREKADVDNGIKEKQRPVININCPYQQLCDRFRQCISLPDEFFKTKYNKCFCDGCHKLRAAPLYKVRGNPAREYAIPTGWYRYGLKVKARAKSLRIFDNWNIAYSGIKLESVRKVLDCGDLLSLADATSRYVGPACTRDYEEKKPETFESVPVILSPSVRYAGSYHFTQPVQYRDFKTDKLYKVRLAFEACVKPGSFNVGPQTLDTNNEPEDPKLDIREIEWATKERGSVEIYGLLIKLEPAL